MKSLLEPFVRRPGLALPPILHELNVVAAAVISRNGSLEEANPGFLRVLPDIVRDGILQDVRGSFINPRFDQFAAKSGNSDDGAVYRGVVNIGDALGKVRSLRGAIYAFGEKLLIVVEPDIAEMEKSLAVLELLNDELARDRQETAETTTRVPHGERPSSNPKSLPQPVTDSTKAAWEQTSSFRSSSAISSARIPVDVAIALLRIGHSSKVK